MANMDMATEIEEVRIETVIKAEYNPRQIEEEQLAKIKGSLNEFGWLIPSYKNSRTGKLLSGHQRSRSYEGEIVPTIILDISTAEEVVINLKMNEITADFPVWIKEDNDFVFGLPATEVIFESNYNGKYTTQIDVVPISKLNFDSYKACVISGMLMSHHSFIRTHGFIMPVVIDTKGNVITGGYKLLAGIELGYEVAPVIIVDWELEMSARFFEAVNYEYGKFDFDELLANARSSQRYVQPARTAGTEDDGSEKVMGGASVKGFSTLWRFFGEFWNTKKAREFSIAQIMEGIEKNLPFGKDTKILDFGCGYCQEADRFIAHNYKNVQKFEPFFQGKNNNIDRQTSKGMATMLLRKLKRGVRFDIATLNTVLNSVMLEEDRQKVLLIVSWMMGEEGGLILSNRGQRDSDVIVNTKTYKHKNGDIEKGRAISAYDNEKQVQILVSNGIVRGTFFYTEDGMKADLLKYFHEVEVIHDDKISSQKKTGSTSYVMVGRRPRYVMPEKFIEAMEWEFSIPYNETENLGCGDMAKEIAEKMVAEREGK